LQPVFHRVKGFWKLLMSVGQVGSGAIDIAGAAVRVEPACTALQHVVHAEKCEHEMDIRICMS
jgi:hypothetical protein